jgi:acyl-CoA synthetase (AMP-forming)/AMP-acid ligase II
MDERRSEYLRIGHWNDDTLDDLFLDHVRMRPDRVAVVDETSSLTFRELADQVSRVAGYLRGLGVGRGDVVSLQLPNIKEFVVSHLAAERLGAITNPMLSQYRRHDIEKQIIPLETKVAIVPVEHRNHRHAEMWAEIAGDRPGQLNVIAVGPGELPEGVHRFADAVACPDAVTERGFTPPADETCIIIFTSGTVASKGVMHNHHSTMYGFRSYRTELDLTHEDVVWMPSPISHGTGLQWGVRSAVALGAKLVLQDAWDPEAAIGLIGREGCTITMGATPFIYDLRRAAGGRKSELASMRYFACAGAPIPREVMVGVSNDLGFEVLRAYGMSEHFVSTICRPNDPEDKRVLTDGRPFDGTEVAVFDETRTVMLPPGEVGELAVRGPGVASGYLKDPARTAETWNVDGWQFSEDLASIDADGFVTIRGRIKDLIIRGGINISPSEIEALILEHPAVVEVGIVGLPDERLGERICAVIVSSGDELDLKGLTAFLTEKEVSKLKLPEVLLYVSELPKTPSGKVKKDVLQKRAIEMVAQSA